MRDGLFLRKIKVDHWMTRIDHLMSNVTLYTVLFSLSSDYISVNNDEQFYQQTLLTTYVSSMEVGVVGGSG